MKWSVAILLVAVTLAGCSSKSGHPLDPYVMDTGDTPDACYYIDPKDEDFAFLASAIGFEKNPGSMNGSLLEVDGIAPERNRLAFFECKFSAGVYQFGSAAMRFADADDADAYARSVRDQSGFVSCVGQAEIFTDGAVIGAVVSISEDEAWHPAFAEKKDKFLQRLYDDGATDFCAQLG